MISRKLILALVCPFIAASSESPSTGVDKKDSIVCRVTSYSELREDFTYHNYHTCDTDQTDFKIKLSDSFLEQNPEISHGATISIPRVATTSQDGYQAMDVSPDVSVTVVDQDRRRVFDSSYRHGFTGTYKVLAIRITTDDYPVPNPDRDFLASRLFGIGAEEGSRNILQQWNECSHGKVKLIPATGEGVVDGILDMHYPQNSTTQNFDEFSRKIFQSVQYLQGEENDTGDQIRFFLFCYPYWVGAVGKSILDTKIGWYSRGYCAHGGVAPHEMGHGLGMHHAGNSDRAYGDHTSHMGGISPLGRCFNAFNHYYLKWYTDRELELDGSSLPWTGKLVTPPDYPNTTSEHVVILKIGRDYLQYNRAKKEAFELSTRYYDKLVSVTRGRIIYTATPSLEMALLNLDNPVFTIDNFEGKNQTLVMEVCDVSTSEPEYVTMSIHIENGQQVSYCRGGVQPTASPSSSQSPTTPTTSPSFAPTSSPSDSPTIMPTTLAPTAIHSDSPSLLRFCEDVPGSTFLVDARPRWMDYKDCAWLSGKKVWQRRLCRPGHPAYDACPELCGKCSDFCHDDETFEIYINAKFSKKGCSWLSIRPVWANRMCKVSYVADACRETCGTCSLTENEVNRPHPASP